MNTFFPAFAVAVEQAHEAYILEIATIVNEAEAEASRLYNSSFQSASSEHSLNNYEDAARNTRFWKRRLDDELDKANARRHTPYFSFLCR